MMLAICRGYISAAPTLEELDAAKIPAEDQQEFTMSGLSVPMVARSELDITDFVFPMLPTASVKITVLKPDGQPLPNADVSMWPNQCFPGRGSNIIGEAYSTTKALLAPNDVRLKIWSRGSEEQVKALGIRANVNHFYMTKTNESGVAELHTLPAGTPEAPVKIRFPPEIRNTRLAMRMCPCTIVTSPSTSSAAKQQKWRSGCIRFQIRDRAGPLTFVVASRFAGRTERQRVPATQ